MRKFVDILKIVWQMPQIIFGCIYLLFLKIIGGILMKTNYKGIDVYRKNLKEEYLLETRYSYHRLVQKEQ